MKKEPTVWDNIFASDTWDKGLISKIWVYKDLTQLNNRKTIQLKHGQGNWIDTSPKRTYRWPRDIWKNAPSERCKLTPHWTSTSDLQAWLSSINQQTTRAGEDGKREPWCTVGENTECCRPYGKYYRISSKNSKWNCLLTQWSYFWEYVLRTL